MNTKQNGRVNNQAAGSRAAVQTRFGAAVRHQQAGRLAAAEQGYRHVLAIDARHADSLCLLGVIALQKGRHAAGAELLGRAIGVREDVSFYHLNLGDALQSQGQLAEAVAHYQRALVLQPTYVEAHNNLGVALQSQCRLTEAVAHFRRALALRPDAAEVHNNLGNALKKQNKLAEAMLHYERAIGFRRDYAEAHNNLGNAYVAQGKTEEAQRAYETAIELAPRAGLYYLHLLYMTRAVAGNPHVAAMQSLAQDMPSLPIKDQMELHFALGKAYADLQQHELSFHHLLAGNALKRREIVYDERETLGFFDRNRAVFTSDLLNRKQGIGDPSRVPVFIVGMPRSGTTLVEQILASHPQVFAGGERSDFAECVAGLSTGGAAAPFPEIVPVLPDDILRRLGGTYVDAVRAEAPSALRITDKMPVNFNNLGLIHLALPNARIIHVRRDPVDTCLSCFKLLFEGNQPFSYDLAELGRYYRGYAALMQHWRCALPAGVMLEVEYEEIVADFEGQARRIVAHCDLQWDDACLAFHRTERPIWTASAIQVRQPIYRTSIGSRGPYMRHLQPLIGELDMADEAAG